MISCRPIFSISIIILICFSMGKVFSQGQANLSTPSVIPPSPNAAAMAKYGDFPVSQYTGTPNISIPLYEIKEGDISVPISMNYHASGIKVNEVASWVGLGWTLSAGGMITRSVRGKPDEDSYFLSPTIARPIPNLSSSPLYDHVLNDFDYLESVLEGRIDTQPDIFYFNFLGRAGKFIFDQNGNAHSEEYQKMKIIRKSAYSFEITTEDGIVYTFGKYRYRVEAYAIDNSSTNFSGPDMFYISTWHLCEIISPNEDEIVTFNYKPYSTQAFIYPTETRFLFPIYGDAGSQGVPVRCNPGVNYDLSDDGSLNSLNVSGNYLSEILFDQGKIILQTDLEREDMPSTAMKEVKLDKLTIVNSQSSAVNSGNHIKSFDFEYGYFNNNVAGAKRLKLAKIIEKDFSGSILKPYAFTYNEEITYSTYNNYSLPPLNSMAQDHWGYYNGAVANTTMLPPTEYLSFSIPGGDREPGQAKYLKAGILEKIEYPTKGYTLFEFEPHDTGGGVEPKKLWKSVTVDTDLANGVFNEDKIIVPQQATLATFTFERPSPNFLIDNDFKCTPKFSVTNLQNNSALDIMPAFAGDQQRIVVKSVLLEANVSYKISVNESDFRCVERATAQQIRDMNSSVVVTYYEIGSEMVPVSKKTVGGLRIKSISQYDGIALTPQTVKNYVYEASGGVSSGQLVDEPLYDSWQNVLYYSNASQTLYCTDCPCTYIHICRYLVTSSSSKSELGSTQGSHIGYSKVEVNSVNSGQSNGRSVFFYSFITNGGNHYEPPFPPVTSFEAFRGKLYKEIDYDKDENIVKEIFYNYSHEKVRELVGLSVGRKYLGDFAYVCERPGNVTAIPRPLFDQKNFFHFVIWTKLDNVVTKVYDVQNPGRFLQSTKTFSYSREHLQMTDSEEIISDGRKIKTSFSYPSDFSDLESGTVVNKLKERYMHNIVLQKTISQEEDGFNKVISSQINVFDSYQGLNGKINIVPKEKVYLNTPVPLDRNNPLEFPVYKPASGYDVTKFKKELNYDLYDAKGNLLQYHKENDVNNVYLWSYKNSYPIAEIKNATYQDVLNILGQAVIDDLANSSNLSPAQISQINSLRTHANLKKAFITTYVYDLLVGMTSSSDSNNITTHYEYDSLHRLSLVKDNNGNIIKRYEYNYVQGSN
jgi:hypothetical protein